MLLSNSSARIDKWFPKSIYIHDNFAESEADSMKIWLSEFFIFNGDFKRTEELNVNTSHLVYDLSEQPELSVFRDLLKKEVLSFAKTLGYNFEDNDIVLQNMWSNLSVTGDYLFPHNHPSSFISGAYYVESTSLSDVIKFYDNPQCMIPPSHNPNEYSYEYVSYKCLEKRLILFKSDFMHGCPALVGDRKIVVSFNYGIVR